MTTILTLTMNPAIDVCTSVDRVAPTRKLRCSAARRDPGGGGINVARVARRLGAEGIAVYPAGGFAGQLLAQLVSDEGVVSIIVPVREETREDFTALETATNDQYRFVLPGPRLSGAEWMACLKAFAELDHRPDFIVVSGSLPPGVPDDFFARIAEIARSWGVRMALDASGPAFKAALEQRPWLIKPNLRELRELTGEALDDEPSQIAACRGLVTQGKTDVVALTLGAQGALLVSAERAWRTRPLSIRPVSTVGAGDSFMGGMVWALGGGKPLEEAFRWAAAASSAALLAPGTELCRFQDVKRLLPQIVVEAAGSPAFATT